MGCGASSSQAKAAPNKTTGDGEERTSESGVCVRTSFGKGGEMDEMIAGIAGRLSSTMAEDGCERNSRNSYPDDEDDEAEPAAPPAAANEGSSAHVVVSA